MRRSDALVSVGLPVRNGADRIGEVVRSVLAQDHPHIELVICDNASTDHTEDVCRDLVRADSRVVYHRHQDNIGLTEQLHIGHPASPRALTSAGSVTTTGWRPISSPAHWSALPRTRVD